MRERELLELCVELAGYPMRAVPLNKLDAGFMQYTGPCLYAGIRVIAASVTPEYSVYDGRDTTGALVDFGQFSAQTMTYGSVLTEPVLCVVGLYVDLTGAASAGSVHMLPLDRRYR